MKTRYCFMNRTMAGIVFAVAILLIPVCAFSNQDFYYTFDGKKVHLEVAADQFVVKPAEPDLSAAEVQSRLQVHLPVSRVQPVRGLQTDGYFEVHVQHPIADPQAVREELGALLDKTDWVHVEPVFLLNKTPLIAYDVFMVKLDDASEYDRLIKLNEKYGVEVVSRNVQLPNLITLRMHVPSEYSVTEMARLYFEQLHLRYSTPSFKREITKHQPVNDPYYVFQFYHHMTQAAFSWDITTGSENIVVAVIDDGVMAHEDLPAGRLVNGFDAFGPGNGAPGGNEAHGMAVAGIIAATHNNLGIAGLAPNVQVMPVRIFDEIGDGTDDNGLVNACAHAVNNGAEVINNSWGFFFQDGSSVTDPNHIPALTNCITDAMENGRNGDGIVVIFASGNNGQEVTYPANVPGVISVGAVDENDIKFGYSAEGPQLDIVAPSGEIGIDLVVQCGLFSNRFRTTLYGTVWTLDQDGANGWNPGNTNIDSPNCFNEYQWSTHSGQPTPGQAYTAHFGGTSAAAPQISGTTALMLTVNPDLTLDQVRDILHYTADWSGHMGGSPPTDEYGHGRLNAYEAVKHALPNQLNSPFFAVWPSQDIGGSHIFGDSYLEFGTLIIPQGKAAVFSGTLTGFGGDYAKILVQGNMVVESGTQLLDLSIEVAPTGRLIVRDGATIRPGSLGELLVEGYAGLGSDVVVRRGDIEVAAGGELVVGAGSELYFTTGKGLTAWGRVALNGYNGKPVVMNIDPALSGTWAGVHLHGAGSELAYVHITGAVNGVSAYNTGNISLNSVQVYGSSFDGFRLVNAAADTWNIRADGNLRHGILYDGAANGGVSTSILKGNEYTGIKLEGGAVVWQAQNSRIYDGLTNGIRADDGSYIAVSGSSIHDNAYLAAAS